MEFYILPPITSIHLNQISIFSYRLKYQGISMSKKFKTFGTEIDRKNLQTNTIHVTVALQVEIMVFEKE